MVDTTPTRIYALYTLYSDVVIVDPVLAKIWIQGFISQTKGDF